MADNGEPVPGSLFIYAPNKIAPVVFAAAYAVSAVGHIWQCLYIHYNSSRLIGLHPLCAVLFTLGYGLREYGAFNYFYTTQNLLIFIFSQVFIYICPPLLELANYHVLGRIFYYVPHCAPLPPGKVLRVFGGLMALVELLNALGVALSANPTSSHTTQELGTYLTITAIAIQLAIIAIFVIMAAIFQRRCSKAGVSHNRTISTPINTLYASMALIFTRCIYRLVQHMGNNTVKLKDVESLRTLSPVLRYEWFFYVFEASLMLINSALWNVWNPARYLPRDYHVYLSLDGRTEVQGEATPDGRSLLEKFASVMTFGIFFRPKKEEAGAFREHGQATPDKRSLLEKAGSVLTLGIFFRPKKGSGALRELEQLPSTS
ncbi:RTA1 domain-containing protein [Apodospora peruviana]|uniref:RTA1 domain-containing protein n=1 Tax=Apodospora peruviana TaxID=516989 RepID=A0AAE0ILS9_9PEZI|nr:RTA1 domain-containing protein [Apodospora peruviana]